jgi:Mrp family chromosome partitioning ATPase
MAQPGRTPGSIERQAVPAQPSSERTIILAPTAPEHPQQQLASNRPPSNHEHRPYSQPPPAPGPQQQQQRWQTGPEFRAAPPPQPQYAAVPPLPTGAIRLQGKLDDRLVLLSDPDSARAASFRLLRDNLLAKRLPRILAVSSAVKRDGKTTCALNLALALAEGSRTLLLDGNLFDPALAKVFAIDQASVPPPQNVPWLAPYRVAELSRTLHVAVLIVPPGQNPPRYEKQWFDALIGNLRRYPYDHVVVDAPAVTVSPTVSQLVSAADAALLAVRSGGTTARALRRAVDQLPDGKAFGVALIDAAPT